MSLIGTGMSKLLEQFPRILQYRKQRLFAHEYKMCQRQHADHPRVERLLSQENAAGCSDSQFRARKPGGSVGNTRRTSRLAYFYILVSQKGKNCSPGLKCSKIGGNNDLSLCQGWMSSNDLRRLLQ